MSSQNDTTLTSYSTPTESYTSPTPTFTLSNSSSSNITSTTTHTSFTSSVITTTVTPTTTTDNGGGIPIDFSNPITLQAANQSGLSTQLLICGVSGILLFLVFCFLRTRWTVIFAPRKHMRRQKPPKLPDSFFGWIIPFLRIPQEEMINKVGLDAAIMLDFLAMGIKIFGICSFFGVVVLIPISATTGNFTDSSLGDVDHMSMAVVKNSSGYLIPYLIFTYIFTFITWYFLQQNYDTYIYKRAKYILHRSNSLVCKSIIITGLPIYLRTDRDLAEYIEKYVKVGRVESCHIIRHVHNLGKITKTRAYYLKQLERYYAIYLGNPSYIKDYDPDKIMEASSQNLQRRSSLPQIITSDNMNKMDNINNNKSKDDSNTNNNDLNNKLWDENTNDPSLTLRKNRIDSNNAIGNNNKNNINNISNNEKVVSSDALSSQPTGPDNVTISTTRVRPQVKSGFLGLWGEKVDAIDHYTKLFNEYDLKTIKARESSEYDMTSVAFVTFEEMSSALIASQITINPVPFRCRVSKAFEPRDVIWNNMHINGKERIMRTILVWTVTVLLVFFWTVPIAFFSVLTSIDFIKARFPSAYEVIAGSPFLINIFQGFIPTVLVNIFMALVPLIMDSLGYVQGLRARSAIAESTLSKYFFFLIYNVLIVFTVSFSLSAMIDIINKPVDTINALAVKLPAVSSFFINYTIMQGFLLMPLNLLLLGSLIVRGFSVYFSRSPREHASARAPDSFNYGIGYPAPLLIFIIVLEYSVISPIILVFGCIYFCTTYFVYKYQFLYVYFRPYEAAGELWTKVFPRIIAGMIIFQLTMLGLFTIKGFFVLSILCIPLIFFTLVFKFTIDAAYKENSVFISMQLLRQYQEDESCDLTVFNSSESADLRTDSNDNRNTNNDLVLPTTIAGATLTESPNSSHSHLGKIKNKWLNAIKTMKESARENLKVSSILHKDLKRKKTVILDEDNYRAIPDKKTDYRQPPMVLNPGVLDTGLRSYGNPYIIGALPQLWLPLKHHNDNDNDNKNNEKKQKRPTARFRRRSSLIQNQELNSRGDSVHSETSVTSIANMIRMMDKTEMNHVTENQQPNTNGSNKSDSVSFLGRIGRVLSNTSILSSSSHQDKKEEKTNDHTNESDSDSSDSDSSDSDLDGDSMDNESISPFHKTYYPHKQQRQRQQFRPLSLQGLRYSSSSLSPPQHPSSVHGMHVSSSPPSQRSPLHMVNSAPSVLDHIHNDDVNNNNKNK
ncbi:unnamed protein product [Cunninghamella blakesleeana]